MAEPTIHTLFANRVTGDLRVAEEEETEHLLASADWLLVCREPEEVAAYQLTRPRGPWESQAESRRESRRGRYDADRTGELPEETGQRAHEVTATEVVERITDHVIWLESQGFLPMLLMIEDLAGSLVHRAKAQGF